MKLELDIPDSALSALRKAPREFTVYFRLMAAAKLYELGELSQERAAELAGLSRQQFIDGISRLGVAELGRVRAGDDAGSCEGRHELTTR